MVVKTPQVEATLLKRLDERVSNADPEELGLQVDANGLIIDY